MFLGECILKTKTYQLLIAAVLVCVSTWNEAAMVRSANLLGHFFAPCGGFDILGIFVMVIVTLGLDIGCVALRLKPGAANLRATPGLNALFDQGLEACLHSVVERNFLEANLARLPEGIIVTLSFLHGFELCHKSFVAGCDVLVPTLLNLLFF